MDDSHGDRRGDAFALAVVIVVATGQDSPTDPYFIVFFPLLIAGVAAIVGATQQAVLRRAILGVRGWIPATAVGGGLAMFVAMVVPHGHGLRDVVTEGAWHGLAAGAVIGVAQWLALRGRLVNSRIWVAVSVVAWSVGAAVGEFIGYYADGSL